MSEPNYSEILKTARKRMGLSQEKMAELLGVSDTSLKHWERGKLYPGETARWIIEQKLGIVLPGRDA